MKSISLIIVLLVSFSAIAETSLKDQAEQRGCELDSQDNSICTYPARTIDGAEAIKLVGERFYTTTGESVYFEADGVCNVVWAPAGDQLGYLAFVDPETNKPRGQFYFASGLNYTYQIIDYGFDYEQDFYLKHQFRVQGAAASKYLVIFHEDGDGGYSISFNVNSETMSLSQFCDKGF